MRREHRRENSQNVPCEIASVARCRSVIVLARCPLHAGKREKEVSDELKVVLRDVFFEEDWGRSNSADWAVTFRTAYRWVTAHQYFLLAQISEGGDTKQLYDELFAEDGSETCLKSIDLYFDLFP